MSKQTWKYENEDDAHKVMWNREDTRGGGVARLMWNLRYAGKTLTVIVSLNLLKYMKIIF